MCYIQTMLYLVGGCSRSGKSTLAGQMRVRHGVPWFPLDALKMAFSWEPLHLVFIRRMTISQPLTLCGQLSKAFSSI